ncbi:MAG: multiheme c-type cytochrome [bacterium]
MRRPRFPNALLAILAHAAVLGATSARFPLLPATAHAAPETSAECGECHKEIYRTWSGSAHAKSMEDPIFLDAFRMTESREGDEVARVCLRCHAPLFEHNNDRALAKKVTWEGVNCDVCHSLVSVDMSGFGPRQVLDVGEVKRGPIRDAASGAHEVAYSELHTTSLVCAGCHEFVNAEGTPLMTTYTEWQESQAAKDGRNCQECHMGRTKADVVDPKIARVADSEINIHEVPGGHSLDQLHKAIGVLIESQHVGDSLGIMVRLTNKGAGHAVPTGMPGRRVILRVGVRVGGGATMDESRVYEKSFIDSDGSRIREDSRFFTKGVRLESDTRIQPDERRVETFRFPVPARSTAYVTASLQYEHAPTGGPEGMTRITFYTDKRTIRPAEAGSDGVAQ